MRRRTVLAGAAAAGLARPRHAAAQRRSMPVIGLLVSDNAPTILASLRDALRELGHVEGSTLRVEVRSSEGRDEQLDRLAAELVSMPVDLIVAWLTPATLAAKRATRDIPIVMSTGDPVGSGIVASLARPGGNVTGSSGLAVELGGKLLELLRETLPMMRRAGVLVSALDPFARGFLDQFRSAATKLEVELLPRFVEGSRELEAAFAALTEPRVDVVIVQPILPQVPVLDLARRHAIPVASIWRGLAEAGAVLTYGARFSERMIQVAAYVDRILKGTRPEDLPVAQPTRFELVVNLATARALGLRIPALILAQADEVIE